MANKPEQKLEAWIFQHQWTVRETTAIVPVGQPAVEHRSPEPGSAKVQFHAKRCCFFLGSAFSQEGNPPTPRSHRYPANPSDARRALRKRPNQPKSIKQGPKGVCAKYLGDLFNAWRNPP